MRILDLATEFMFLKFWEEKLGVIGTHVIYKAKTERERPWGEPEACRYGNGGKEEELEKYTEK